MEVYTNVQNIHYIHGCLVFTHTRTKARNMSGIH